MLLFFRQLTLSKVIFSRLVLLIFFFSLFFSAFSQTPQLILPSGHRGGIGLARFGDNGKIIITTGREDNTVFIWDVSTGKKLTELKGLEGKVNYAISFNEDRYIFGVTDDAATAWEINTGKQLYSITGLEFETLYQPLKSPDGLILALPIEGDKLLLVELLTGRKLVTLKTGDAEFFCFSNDSKQLGYLIESENGFNIWDIHKGKDIWVNPPQTEENLCSIRFSNNQQQILTGTNRSSVIYWDAKTGKKKKVQNLDFFPGQDEVYGMYMSSAGQVFVYADRLGALTDSNFNLIRLFNYGSNDFNSDIIQSPFSKNGGLIAINSSTDTSIFVQEEKTGKEIMQVSLEADFNPESTFACMDWSKTGKRFLVSTTLEIKIFDTETRKLFNTIIPKQRFIGSGGGFSLDGKYILSTTFASDISFAMSEITITNILTGQQARNINTQSFLNPDSSIVSIAGNEVYSTNNRYVFRKKNMLTEKGLISTGEIILLKTGKVTGRISAHENFIVSAVFTPDEKLLITSSYDGKILVWNCEDGSLHKELDGHTGPVSFAFLSRDKKSLISCSADSSVIIWNLPSFKLQKRIISGEPVFMMLELDPDNPYYILFSKENATFYFPDTDLKIKFRLDEANWGKDFQERLKNMNHRFSLFFGLNDANGQTNPKEGAIGKLSNLTELTPLIGHKYNLSMCQWSSNDKLIATSDTDNNVFFWATETGNTIKSIHLNDSIVKIKFSPNDAYVYIITKKALSLYSTTDWKLLGSLSMSESFLSLFNLGESVPDYLKNYFFSVDSRYLIKQSDDLSKKSVIIELPGMTNIKEVTGFLGISPDSKLLLTGSGWFIDVKKTDGLQTIYSFGEMENGEQIILDPLFRYDGRSEARKLLYCTCGMEVIELDQVKEQLWVPNLAERLMKGEVVNTKTLGELNICGLTALVEEEKNQNGDYIFTITPRRGGLGETLLYVNGIETKRYRPEQLKKINTSYELKLSRNEISSYFTTGLSNKISLKALTADNTISSRSVIVDEEPDSNSKAAPNLYAVVVGVSDYKGDELDLRYASKDAKDFAAMLEIAAKKFLDQDTAKHVFVYPLHTEEGRYLFPEKANIRDLLKEIGKKAKPNDILLVFFAGHGKMNNDVKQFHFITADASKTTLHEALTDVSISSSELTEWIKPGNIKAQKRILIFDACYSGQAIKDFVKLGEKDQNYVVSRNDEKAEQIRAIERLNERSGLFILCASASTQKAYEMSKYSQGVLTYSLLNAIKFHPEILFNNKYLNISSWFNIAERTLSDIVKETNAPQQAQMVSTTGFNIGVVDDEVRNSIKFPLEKILFTRSVFRNTSLLVDDLKLRTYVDKELKRISDENSASGILFSSEYDGNEVFAITCDYNVTGDVINAVVILTKGGTEIIAKIETRGSLTQPEVFANTIVMQALKKAGVTN